MSILDGLLNLSDLFLSMLFTVGLHVDLFLFFPGFRPDLNVIHLLFLLDLELLLFLPLNALVLLVD